MRFAYTAFDTYRHIIEAFVECGWQPVKVFTWPLPNMLGSANRQVIESAARLKIPIQLSRITEDDMQDLADRGCDALIGAGYGWRIGAWQPYLRYAFNFHPSPLPEGRGPYPLVRALLEGRRSWGVSCHKFDKDFDTGDILAQRHFPVAPSDCHESLMMKVQMHSSQLACEVAQNLAELWPRATPQGPGSYWGRWSEQEATIDYGESVEAILRKIRAFGLIEMCTMLTGVRVFVRRAVGWTETHEYAPGTVVHNNERQIVVAARDGFIGLVEWSTVDPFTYRELGR
jgi:methionyl-tRNA formyltransferase